MTRGKGHLRTSTSSPIPCAPAAMRGLGRGRVVSEPVRLLDERRYDPPRHVEVELNGQWWPGLQHAWRLTSDRDHWVADVEFAAVYDWGLGKHFHCVPPGRVRLAAAEPADRRTGHCARRPLPAPGLPRRSSTATEGAPPCRPTERSGLP